MLQLLLLLLTHVIDGQLDLFVLRVQRHHARRIHQREVTRFIRKILLLLLPDEVLKEPFPVSGCALLFEVLKEYFLAEAHYVDPRL